MANIVKLPSLIDMHVHLRDDASGVWSHKEDFETGTRAAIAGGFTLVMDMPNNPDQTVTEKALLSKIKHAQGRVYCDMGFHFGADPGNFAEYGKIIPYVYGLKIYMNHTTGNMLVDDPAALDKIFATWSEVSKEFAKSAKGPHSQKPILAHAEAKTLEYAISLAKKYQVPLHVCHVCLEEEILLVKKAKEAGLPVTCEATCNNLFLCEDDLRKLGPYCLMKPHVGKKSDLESLWKNLDFIDCVATDHAPHTREEKDSDHPPFGVPGLETAMPLMLTAVNEGRLSLERLTDLMSAGPARLFNIQLDKDTYTEVDTDVEWVIDSKNLYTKCGWTPFEGWKVKGKVREVVLRGTTVFKDGKIIGKPQGVIKHSKGFES